MMTIKAFLFGSIGTLVETSDLQRRAFNQAFFEAGLDWDWNAEVYERLLTKSGGRERIQDYAVERNTSVDATQLHGRKTEIFNALMAEETMSLRSGVASVIGHAIDNNIRLAFVTTTSKANIDAVFLALGDQVKCDDFNFIGNDSMVSNPKPNPDIYLKALSDLQLKAQDCIAIEDTSISMKAALAANVRCVAFPGLFAQTNDFSGAPFVTDSLSIDQLR